MTEFPENESNPKQTRKVAQFYHADEGIVVCKIDIQEDNGDTSSLAAEVGRLVGGGALPRSETALISLALTSDF